ncbi:MULTISPECIES: response regulator transcription factor [unclassified Streptomyces]|uniref:response regulator transcription factor n=1 Tax=unclassified Streptomyces TaxID=2593676 RepID=UPI001F03902E|nr:MULTISPECIES: response regulator transcription factor [unclassified Streptomyces]MCH0564852.1 response regulator transcription factor [Streptomyces sp. MUM 2J]MCH0569874.1 response regulator transcription factor [Streptomyces sp. MUM 136J]
MDTPGQLTTRLFIIDDNVLFREGMAEICDREPDLCVVGRAASGLDAVAQVHRSRPDVVLLGSGTPGDGMEELVARLTAGPGESRLVILALHETVRTARRYLSMGAWGYISKNSTREELLAVVRTVGRSTDRAVLSMPRGVLEQLARPVASPLSGRELEVIELVAAGLSNAQIAGRLHISEGTVKRHLSNAYLKLDVRSRMAAINKAAAMGLLLGRVA